MSPGMLALRYTVIALSASIVNLLLQAGISRLYEGPFSVELSMAAATGIVLPIKYSLERRVIFAFQPDSLRHDAKLFYLYTVVSVFTVLIFWCTEYTFHLIFEDDAMRYLGGAIGLAISFYSKYRLDKRFVFVTASEATG
jgi:hypothetical protein